MTDCPPRLRGDLSKWLMEISAGVYVGQLTGRVRDAVWARVCDHLKGGRAVMVYSTNGEQRMDFKVHGSTWEPVDFEGIRLIRRPLPGKAPAAASLKPGFSKATQYRMAAKAQASTKKTSSPKEKGEGYVLIDLETTGLNAAEGLIVEYGALRVEKGEITASFSALVKRSGALPPKITALTGITEDLLEREGRPPEETLQEFLKFLGRSRLIGFSLAFDMEFLRQECTKLNKSIPTNKCQDILRLARRKLPGLPNHKLATIASHLGINKKQQHRALPDCQLTQEVYAKLTKK